MPTAAQDTPQDRVVFSVLYNESAEFLGTYIDNFLGFTGPEAVLVVNLQPGRDIPLAPRHANGRVFLFNGAVPRRKVGHTLLVGHLEAFGLAAQTIGAFAHFCPLASNSLLVRRFDLAATIRYLAANRHQARVDLADPPDIWWWKTVRQNPRFLDYLRDGLGVTRGSAAQIEGLFAAREDWALLHGRLAEIARLGETMEPEHVFPLEEVLPAIMFLNFGSGHYINICRLLWHRPNGGKVVVNDLLETDAPPHLCALKWFERTAEAPETAAVAQGWSQALLADLQAGDANRRLGQRLVLEQLAAALRVRESFTPFTRDWPRDPDSHWDWPEQAVPGKRALVPLPSGAAAADGKPAAYLLPEDTGHALRISVSLTEAETTLLRLDCAGEAAEVLEGYLYLSSLHHDGQWTFRLRLPLPVTALQAAAMDRMVLVRRDHHQGIVAHHSVEAAGFREYYFRCGEASDGNVTWFGIPFFSGMRIEALLDLMRNR